MQIEAQSATPSNPFDAARASFEDVLCEVSSARALSLSHSELETLLHERGLELMRQILQGHIDLRGPGEAVSSVTTGDGVVLTHERWNRARHWESLFGTISLRRVGYGAKGESMAYPLDADLNLPRERHSLGVRRRVSQEVVRGSFDEAVASMTATTGAHVAKRQAEELTVRAAADFDAFYAESEALPASSSSSLLVLSIDGKGVVMREDGLREATRKAAQKRRPKLPGKRSKGEKSGSKRMATVAAVYEIEPYVRTGEQVVAQVMENVRLVELKRPRPESKRVWASLEKGPDEIIAAAFEEALRRDPEKDKHWVAVVDGNETQLALLRHYARKHKVELTIVLDLMHALSYLWKAAHVFHPEGSQESQEWVCKRLGEVLRGRAGIVAGAMRRSATRRGLDEDERKPVDSCATYFLNHKEYMAYDSYLAGGSPICSGVIEGTCRHLINDRMDRTGARWGLQGAEAVLRLRSIYASGDFDDYWRFHERQERRRNHVGRYHDGRIPAIRKAVTPTVKSRRRAQHLQAVN